jgi:hypothetical protein
MIIDYDGHFTTAPKEREAYRKSQVDGPKDPSPVPARGNRNVTGDQIRETRFSRAGSLARRTWSAN